MTARYYTDKLLGMIDDGILDRDTVIMACVKYMSEDDVHSMMECNEFIEEEEEEEEEDFDLDDDKEDSYDVKNKEFGGMEW